MKHLSLVRTAMSALAALGSVTLLFALVTQLSASPDRRSWQQQQQQQQQQQHTKTQQHPRIQQQQQQKTPQLLSPHSLLSINDTSRLNETFVHQSWKTRDLPPRFMRWFATWDICFPDYQHLLWTDEDNERLVKTKQPNFLPVYKAYKNKIQRADAVRYMYMYHYGGVYTDLDNECLRSFQRLIEHSGCGVILGSMRHRDSKQYIQNSFMYSRRGHPFWRGVIRLLRERRSLVGFSEQDTVDLTTGPKLLMHSVAAAGNSFDKGPDRLCVFPDHYFNPYSWRDDRDGPCKDLNQMTETDLALCKILHKRAFVLQYHTQSWFAGKV